MRWVVEVIFSGLGHHYAQLAVVNFDVAALDISHSAVLLAFRVKHSTSSARVRAG